MTKTVSHEKIWVDLGGGQRVTLAAEPIDLADWQRRARELFGNNPSGYRFRCVSCGRDYSVADWQAAGFDGPRAAHECIGRACTDTEMRARSDRGECVWAANGLFVLAGVVGVRLPDGKVVLAMPFADSVSAVSA